MTGLNKKIKQDLSKSNQSFDIIDSKRKKEDDEEK